MFQFARLASIGYECAQFNLAFLLAKGGMRGLELRPFASKAMQHSRTDSNHHNHNHHHNQEQQPQQQQQQQQQTQTQTQTQTQKLQYASGEPSRSNTTWESLLDRRAVMLFGLSAHERNAEAFLQLGDFYYYKLSHQSFSDGNSGGNGDDDSGGSRSNIYSRDNSGSSADRNREAAAYYQRAADLNQVLRAKASTYLRLTFCCCCYFLRLTVSVEVWTRNRKGV